MRRGSRSRNHRIGTAGTGAVEPGRPRRVPRTHVRRRSLFRPGSRTQTHRQKALGEYYGTVRGKVRIDTYRMIDPVVRLSPALPSWHTITRPSGTGRCSGCTARKFTRPQRPAVGRSSIRTGLSPGRTIEAVRRGRIFAVRGFGMQIARHGAWKKESVNGSHNAGTWIGPYCTCACSREA